MPGEIERRIMKHGSSRVIALPKPYLRFFDLDHGGKVKILFDHIIIILPKSLENLLNEKRETIDELLNLI